MSPSALDAFREQREAADQLHARLTEISALLHQLRHQFHALAIDDELRAVLRQEPSWLERAEVVLSQLRSFREQDASRFWPGVVRRWLVALVLALGSAAVAGASYGWTTKPYAAEVDALRARMEFVEFVEHRVVMMTPAERRQFRDTHEMEVAAAVRDSMSATESGPRSVTETAIPLQPFVRLA